MGFVVERHVETAPVNRNGTGAKKNQAVVYGKAEYMWGVRSSHLLLMTS